MTKEIEEIKHFLINYIKQYGERAEYIPGMDTGADIYAWAIGFKLRTYDDSAPLMKETNLSNYITERKIIKMADRYAKARSDLPSVLGWNSSKIKRICCKSKRGAQVLDKFIGVACGGMDKPGEPDIFDVCERPLHLDTFSHLNEQTDWRKKLLNAYDESVSELIRCAVDYMKYREYAGDLTPARITDQEVLVILKSLLIQ